MIHLHSVSDREQVVDTMIGLTRLTNLHRVIVAGSGSMDLYLTLRQRGFLRAATAATCISVERATAIRTPHARKTDPGRSGDLAIARSSAGP